MLLILEFASQASNLEDCFQVLFLWRCSSLFKDWFYFQLLYFWCFEQLFEEMHREKGNIVY